MAVKDSNDITDGKRMYLYLGKLKYNLCINGNNM